MYSAVSKNWRRRLLHNLIVCRETLVAAARECGHPVGLRRARRGEIISSRPDPPEVVKMCHERWTRRERQREERFDEELRYLLDERERSEPPTPVVERVRPEEPADRERLRVEAATRA
jgi:hypothetical protein